MWNSTNIFDRISLLEFAASQLFCFDIVDMHTQYFEIFSNNGGKSKNVVEFQISFLLQKSPLLTSSGAAEPSEKWGGSGGGGTFFRATFYCIFGQFGKVIHLVNLKKWGGSSPLCPSLYAAPERHYGNAKCWIIVLWNLRFWGKIIIIFLVLSALI